MLVARVCLGRKVCTVRTYRIEDARRFPRRLVRCALPGFDIGYDEPRTTGEVKETPADEAEYGKPEADPQRIAGTAELLLPQDADQVDQNRRDEERGDAAHQLDHRENRLQQARLE